MSDSAKHGTARIVDRRDLTDALWTIRIATDFELEFHSGQYITLGLELSLTTDEYVKLLGLVAHPTVRAYWDATGISKVLRLWAWWIGPACFPRSGSRLRRLVAFETPHATTEACVEQTRRNIDYVMKFLG